jgi:hypothetical protein
MMARPTVMTDAVLRKLEEAFLMGCTDIEACLYADIGERTLYDYCDANPEFSQRKNRLKTNPAIKARKLLFQALESGEADMKTAQWMVEKYDGKAKQAVAVEGGDKPLQVVFCWDDGSED